MVRLFSEIFRFNKCLIKHSDVCNKEVSSAEFLPYYGFWDDETIITKDNWMMKVVKVDGFAFETADDEDVDIRKKIRNQLYRGIANGSFALYFHTIRRKQNAFNDSFADGRIPNLFSDSLNRRWRDNASKSRSFVNELYVTVIKKFDTKGIAFLEHMVRKLNQAASKDAFAESMRDASEELNEITNRVAASLRDYGSRVLGTSRGVYGEQYSEILEFMYKIMNGCQSSRILMPKMKISSSLASSRLYFGTNAIEIVGHTKTRHAGIISLKEYGQTTSAGMLDVFLQLPYELIVTQSYQFTNRQIAINKMQLQQNRMIQARDKAVSQVAEISRALDDAMSGRISFGEHHLTVMCMEDSPRALENAMSVVDAELINTGIYTVREKMNLEAVFWAQMPGNLEYIVRKAVVNTLNLASFASHHNYPIGKKFGNHWGEAVTVLETTSGTPFFFNFHLRDVGHTMIIGPTGAGKTVLLTFLCAQTMKFKPRIFFFDKDRGADIFIRASGGVYTVIEPRRKCGFNPLKLEDTPENRTFLIEWLKCLLTTQNPDLDAADIDTLNEAIDGNFRLPREDRVLRNIAAFLGMDGPGTLAGRLKAWHSGGSHAALFDNDEDTLDLDRASVFGFEMAHLLQDNMSLSPALLYLFHRISISLDGSPTMIVLDEAWALIDNPVFAPKIKDWLKVLRKLNAFVVFATQSVEDASKSQISDTLIQQTATQIFLPNLKATEVYKSVFMLSQREFVIVKHTDPGSRYFLLKQGINSIVGRIDLSSMGDIIDVLSGRAETVLLLDEIIKEVGDNPRDWLPIFYERVKNV